LTKVIDHNNFVYQIKYFSLRKVFEVIDINGNKKIFEDEQEAINNLLSDKEIIIKKYSHLNNTKLKIWVELDKKKIAESNSGRYIQQVVGCRFKHNNF
jgi:hypothetical protein